MKYTKSYDCTSLDDYLGSLFDAKLSQCLLRSFQSKVHIISWLRDFLFVFLYSCDGLLKFKRNPALSWMQVWLVEINGNPASRETLLKDMAKGIVDEAIMRQCACIHSLVAAWHFQICPGVAPRHICPENPVH